MPSSPAVAVVGATGAVGRELLSILEQRRFPSRSVRLLASARSAGELVPFAGGAVRVDEAGDRSFDGVDLAFFAAGAETCRRLAPAALAAGATVIDKSSAFRADPAAGLVIPEVNGDELRRVPRLVAVPNCSTIIVLVPVSPLRRAFGVARMVVSTYQAASGAGAAAMEELGEQSRDVLSGRPATPRVFREPCAFNVFSHDSAIDAATGVNAEEAKLGAETRRIWGDPTVAVAATCVRVPVMRGHSAAINITLREPAAEVRVRAVLAAAPGVRVIDDRAANDHPTPLKASGGDAVLVGRIRPDPTQPSAGTGDDRRWTGYWLFVSGDQLRIGAALTAVRIAERLIAGSAGVTAGVSC